MKTLLERCPPGSARVLYLWLLWALISMSVVAGQVFYVSPTGDDTQPGTQALPLRQIRKALTKVHPGDVVLVADPVSGWGRSLVWPASQP
jgi:hypothetical protein